jgi:predicted nucleotide-binding protein
MLLAMYDEEFARLSDAFEQVVVHDDARLKQLSHELENVVRHALPNDDAERYVKRIYSAQNTFYPSVYIDDYDDTPRTWPQGRAEMVALIDSIKHAMRFAKSSASKKQLDLDKGTIFIVHGQDHAMLREVEAFVRRIEIEPVVLMDEPNRGRTVIEKFERNANVPYAVVLFSPDDVGRLVSAPTGSEKRRPRQNVVLELGFFIGKLGRENVAVITDETVKEPTEYPSDYAGVVTIPYRPDSDWKMRLIREFKASEIEFNSNKS